MVGDKQAITHSLHGKEVYWGREGREKRERKGERQREREGDRDGPPQRKKKSRHGQSSSLKGTFAPAYRVKILLAMHTRVVTLSLPGPQGMGSGLHLPG